MTKKHFVALAGAIQATRRNYPGSDTVLDRLVEKLCRETLPAQNAAFSAERFKEASGYLGSR